MALPDNTRLAGNALVERPLVNSNSLEFAHAYGLENTLVVLRDEFQLGGHIDKSDGFKRGDEAIWVAPFIRLTLVAKVGPSDAHDVQVHYKTHPLDDWVEFYNATLAAGSGRTAIASKENIEHWTEMRIRAKNNAAGTDELVVGGNCK